MSWTWTETRPAGDVNKKWYQVAMSADGLTILASSYTGLYLSTDGGANWTEKSPTGTAGQIWICVAVSGDGTYLIAGSYYVGLWMSTDAGATWNALNPPNSSGFQWFACAISSGGTYIIVAARRSLSYVSCDGGDSWTEWAFGWGGADYTGAAMSADGRYQLMCWRSYGPYYGEVGQVWRSSNYGASWRKCVFPISSDGDFSSVGVSQNGDAMIVASYYYVFGSGARVIVSFDYGATWGYAVPNTKKWRGVSCSYHGTHALACNVGYNLAPGRLYATHDGKNWTNEERPAGDVDVAWISSAISSLGEKAVVVAYEGRMWLGELPSQPAPEFNSCYWDTDTSGQLTTAGTAEGKTTKQMETESTFVDWNFVDVWYPPDSCYPWLRTIFVTVNDGCTAPVVHSFPLFCKVKLTHLTA